MERVTVQYNGEMVTLDVPEGMSDDQIIAFLQQQTQQQQQKVAGPEPSLGDVAGQVAGQSVAKAAMFNPQMTVASPVGPIRPTAVNPTVGNAVLQEAVDLTKMAGQITPAGIRSFTESPSKILQIPGAFIERYLGSQNMNKSAGDVIKGAGQTLMNPQTYKNLAGKVGMAAMAPENILTAPYAMAGYEQEKIRANPTAPEYEYTPYAQQVRGQFATQGAAGAANRRQALAGQQYGGLTQEQQAMLDQDKIDQAIRRKAASRVLGPIAPGM